MEAVTDAPAALPRLSISHLLMWTAATAVAFVPYQWWMSLRDQDSSAVESEYLSIVTTTTYAVYGVSTGAHLFVTACLLFWRGRGVVVRPLQPGHWLAIRGAVAGILSIVVWTAIRLSGEPDVAASRWLSLPHYSMTAVFFFIFLWAAIRRHDPARWRIVFLTMAVASLISLIATMIAPIWYWRAAYFVAPGLAAATQAVVLLLALGGDLARSAPRHWTHWLAAGFYVAGLVGTCAIYFAYAMAYEL
jgi:hypothetical protein